jgi:peptidoglycan/LPS O-acetylase OafA/YrhL
VPADRHAAAVDRVKSTGRVFVLDGLRLLAATMVVFYHYVGDSKAKIGHHGTSEVQAWGTPTSSLFPHALHVAATYGWTGVELFFLISGFVICMSGWGRRPADFFISRFVRLFPAYWTSIALTALLLILLPRLTSGVRPSMVLMNMSMVQSAYGVPNLDPVYWTLLVELTFYVLFGLVAISGATYQRAVGFCMVWFVASIVAADAHNPILNILVIPRYSPYFIAGIAFYLIHRFGSNLLLWAIVGYSWLLTLHQPRANPPLPVTVLLTSFFVIMGLIATHRLDRIRWRWLTVAGALTYPLYLVHQDIGFTVFSYLGNRVSASVLAMATYVAMLGLAWLIYRAVERPLAPLLRARLVAAMALVRQSGSGTGGPAGRALAFEGVQPGERRANGNGRSDASARDQGTEVGWSRCVPGGSALGRALRPSSKQKERRSQAGGGPGDQDDEDHPKITEEEDGVGRPGGRDDARQGSR